ncbi:GpE family phage tail protein [Silvimonas sp.]|nr:GpE family phage tail protein [Silvimonas sp.]
MIFTWGPDVLDPLSLTELAQWRERARKRSGSED